MINSNTTRHRPLLEEIARRAMIDRGLVPDFSPQAIFELDKIKEPVTTVGGPIRDLRNLLWCSIDNDSSRDLDQLTVAEVLPYGAVKVLVAIADVDSLVKKLSAIDDHARLNTASVYTAARIFPMLPEKLSTNLTSLNFGSDRRALVIEMMFADDGSLQGSVLYQAIVRNHAKLAYNAVAAWLENNRSMPHEIATVKGLEENLRLQDRVAQKLKSLRHIHGALDLETIEASPVFDGDALKGLEADKGNRAKSIIEDFMIAANGATARFLSSKNLPSIRRVVRTPKRWDRIVELALQHDFRLPNEPDSKALALFLTRAKSADPLRFPDLCLSVIKLLGPGEYIVELPGTGVAGHFGLAVRDYAHSTAPNRRYPDLITQRLLKAAIATEQSVSYTIDELKALAKHCTEMENVIKKIERQVTKSAAALLLEPSIGQQFDALVTGASGKGTWVRITNPPVEGRLVKGYDGLDVGHRLRVKLVGTNVERGFIDFERD
jgi:VacB/RNase II family 3'-5' exoribonuclease